MTNQLLPLEIMVDDFFKLASFLFVEVLTVIESLPQTLICLISISLQPNVVDLRYFKIMNFGRSINQSLNY